MKSKPFHIFLPMTPTPKLRAITTSRGTFTPQKTRVAESQVKTFLRVASPPFFKGPISLTVNFIFKKPKSAKKRIHHTVRPDLDNLVKLIKDSCNGILWKDDSEVSEIHAYKSYSGDGLSEGIHIYAEERY